MTEQTAAEALRALAQGTENRSKIGRLRGVYDEVEKAQRAGVSNSKIVETLNGQGFDLTLKTFETMLYRIRQERAKQAAPARPVERPSVTTPAPVAPSAEAREEEQQQAGQGDDLTGLSPKERREKRADQFIKAETTNPLFKRLKEQK